MNIWYGSNENAWLSNLYHRPFSYGQGDDAWTYMSVEHAYQTLKSGAFDVDVYWNDRWQFSGAKIVGRLGTKTNGNWNVGLMRKLVFKSFIDNTEEAERLCNTNAVFTHCQDKGIWRECFPKILMAVREDLKRTKHSWQQV